MSAGSALPRRRRPKWRRAQRLRPNLKEPSGRLRERKAALERRIDPARFDRALSLALDRVIQRLEGRV